MTYIPDLAMDSYSELKGPIRAVGWLESSRPFTRGTVSSEFADRLVSLIEYPIFELLYLGFHWCSLCEAEGKIGPNGTTSQLELLVPGSGCVYEAPIWIGHYVLGHSYRPPDEFCRAVLSCPEPGSEEYRKALVAKIRELGTSSKSAEDFFDKWDARLTLYPDLETGSERLFNEAVARIDESTEEIDVIAVGSDDEIVQPNLPTPDEVVAAHGGLSSFKCESSGCENQALSNLALCLEHAYPVFAGLSRNDEGQ